MLSRSFLRQFFYTLYTLYYYALSILLLIIIPIYGFPTKSKYASAVWIIKYSNQTFTQSIIPNDVVISIISLIVVAIIDCCYRIQYTVEATVVVVVPSDSFQSSSLDLDCIL